MTPSHRPIAMLDACVLYGVPLRGLLMALARAGLFRARWSDDIVRECDSALRKRNAGTLCLADAPPDGRVVGFAHLVPALSLPDPDDRHVLAAAIAAGADTIVTWNISDFPADTLRPYGIAALDPDSFILHLIARDRATVLEAMRLHRAGLGGPAVTPAGHRATLRAERLFRTVKALTPWLDQP